MRGTRSTDLEEQSEVRKSWGQGGIKPGDKLYNDTGGSKVI